MQDFDEEKIIKINSASQKLSESQILRQETVAPVAPVVFVEHR